MKRNGWMEYVKHLLIHLSFNGTSSLEEICQDKINPLRKLFTISVLAHQFFILHKYNVSYLSGFPSELLTFLCSTVQWGTEGPWMSLHYTPNTHIHTHTHTHTHRDQDYRIRGEIVFVWTLNSALAWHVAVAIKRGRLWSACLHVCVCVCLLSCCES